MINTDCLKRINHHHHYHEQDQSNWVASLEICRRSGPLIRKISSNLGSSSFIKQKQQQNYSYKMQPFNLHSTNTRFNKSSPTSSSSASSLSSSSSSLLLLLASSKYLKKSSSQHSNSSAFIFALVTFTTLALILLIQVPGARSLKCYTCSSADNPACDEPFTGRVNMSSVDCEQSISKPAKNCRKIVQYIEQKKVVIRSCGWIDEHADEKKPMCYKRSGTFALMMESCVCYEDNCNHSASLVPNQSVLTVLLTCSTFIYYFLAKHQLKSTQQHDLLT